MPGKHSRNLYGGARSEYLAQYIFSALGTCEPVPRPEDTGIDFHCGIGRMIDHNLLAIQRYYYVQVKSNKNDILYSDKEEVHWFQNLRLPLLFCIVDKKKLVAEIYLTMVHLVTGGMVDLNSITLTFKRKSAKEYPHLNRKDENLEISMGRPILKIGIESLNNELVIERYIRVLESWLTIYHRNIENIEYGFELIERPDEYKVNELIPKPRRLFGFRRV